jgi:Fe-S oxidoreductase
MCRHVCPVGHVTQRETLTPHGWALTIDSVHRGTLQWNDDSVDVLYACADCGLCRTHCVTDQPLPDAIAAARAEVAAAGIAPKAAYAIDEKLQRWANPYEAREPAAVTAQADVVLFVGDAAAHLEPRSVEAAIALLGAAGIRHVQLGAGRSTGLLASSLGFPGTAATLARAVLAEVAASGCRELLVLGPGDRYAFERLYHERLDLAWPADVVIKDVTTVLAEALSAGRVSFRRRANVPPYAYHDPCHGPRVRRDAASPRALLAAALGSGEVRMFWRGERAHPCGAIGGLEFTQPAIAAKLADARVADAVAAGASWLVADDPSCLHHLRTRPNGGVAVQSFYELLVDQLDALPSPQPYPRRGGGA